MRPAFYDNPDYKKKQSEQVRQQWAKGTYNFRIKSLVARPCANLICSSLFKVKPSSPKIYCGRSCAVSVSNSGRPTIHLAKEELKTLYSSGSSMSDIAKRFDCSVHKVTYWMKKFAIEKRSLSETMYLKANPNGDPFNILEVMTPDQILLYGLGLGIYWGEGDKTTAHGLRVANTDPSLLITFRRFLIEVCRLNPGKIHYSIICFNDTKPEAALNYWSQKLETFPSKFGKIVQIPPQGKGTYKNKSSLGVCTLTVSNIKLKAWIMNEIKKLNA